MVHYYEEVVGALCAGGDGTGVDDQSHRFFSPPLKARRWTCKSKNHFSRIFSFYIFRQVVEPVQHLKIIVREVLKKDPCMVSFEPTPNSSIYSLT